LILPGGRAKRSFLITNISVGEILPASYGLSMPNLEYRYQPTLCHFPDHSLNIHQCEKLAHHTAHLNCHI